MFAHFEQPGHGAAKHAHNLSAFKVLFRLAGRAAVNADKETLSRDKAMRADPAVIKADQAQLDADQKNNAMVVETAGGGWVAEQATLSPQSLGTRLTSLLSDPATLTKAAAAARSLGQPRAVEKLADIAEMLSGTNTMEHTR